MNGNFFFVSCQPLLCSEIFLRYMRKKERHKQTDLAYRYKEIRKYEFLSFSLSLSLMLHIYIFSCRFLFFILAVFDVENNNPVKKTDRQSTITDQRTISTKFLDNYPSTRMKLVHDNFFFLFTIIIVSSYESISLRAPPHFAQKLIEQNISILRFSRYLLYQFPFVNDIVS